MTELEDAAHAEELCKVREEKAELRVRAFSLSLSVPLNPHNYVLQKLTRYTVLTTVSNLHDGAGEASHGAGDQSITATSKEE